MHMNEEMYIKDLVSLIIPVYNAEPYLPRLMNCLRKQTYHALEILLLDDGSADRSGMLCDQYAAEDERIRVIHLDHAGVAEARNRGLDEYRGEYLMFTDADDLFSSQYVKRMHDLITGSGEHLVTCNAYDTEQTDLTEYEYSGEKDTPQRMVWGEIDYRTKASHRVIWGAIYDRYAVEGIRFRSAYAVSTDTLFLAEVTRKIGSYIHVNEELYCYVIIPGSLSHGAADRRKYDEIRVWMKIYESLPEKGISRVSAQRLIIRMFQKMLGRISASADGDRQLYRDICRDLRSFHFGRIYGKTRRETLKMFMFMKAPDTYLRIMKMRRRHRQKVRHRSVSK